MPNLFQRLSNAARALTGREERSIPPFDVSWFSQIGMPALFNPERSLDAFGDSPYLYRAVLAIAMEIATINFKLRVPNAKGEFEFITDHQALETLRLPQPTKGGKSMLTAMDLKIVTAMHLLLNGEAFWVLDKRLPRGLGGGPRFIKPLLAQNMKVDLSKDGEILQYTYDIGCQRQSFDPMDVVHFKLPDPMNMYRGHSPVQSIRYALDTQKKADMLNTNRLSNSAVPAWRAGERASDHAGRERRRCSPSGGRTTAAGERGQDRHAPEGAEVQADPGQRTRRCSSSRARRSSTNEILANYGVGPGDPRQDREPDAGERRGRDLRLHAVRRAALRGEVSSTRSTTTTCLPSRTPRGWSSASTIPCRQNMEEKRANMQAGFAIGAVTPNEVRKVIGMEPLDLPGMDVPYLDMGKNAVGAEIHEPEEPDLEDPDDEEDSLE